MADTIMQTRYNQVVRAMGMNLGTLVHLSATRMFNLMFNCTVILMIIRFPFAQWTLWCCCSHISVLMVLLKLSFMALLSAVQSGRMRCLSQTLMHAALHENLENVARCKCICQSTAWWFCLMAVPEIEISLDSSKAAGPNVSLQLPNTSALKAGPVNEHDTHPMKTLSKYILRSWVPSKRDSPAGFYIHLSVLTMACTVQGCLDKRVGDAATCCNYALDWKNIFYYFHSFSLPCALCHDIHL